MSPMSIKEYKNENNQPGFEIIYSKDSESNYSVEFTEYETPQLINKFTELINNLIEHAKTEDLEKAILKH